MTDNFYTHELWYRSAIDETDQEWTRVEDEDGEWDDSLRFTITKMHPLRARIEIDKQSVNFDSRRESHFS